MSMQTNVTLMRNRWNDAAQHNMFFNIANAACDSEENFIRSGAYDAGRILVGLPEFDPARDNVLEIGCGIGRILRALNDRFAQLHGVDISDEMIQRGRQWLQDYPKIKLSLTGDNTLREYADNSVSFIFSHITFQHIVDRRLIELYIAEAHRVLRPGGYFRFQTLRPHSMVDLVKARIQLFMSVSLGHKEDHFTGYVWNIRDLHNTVRKHRFNDVIIQQSTELSRQSGLDAPFAAFPFSIWCTARK